MRTMRKNIIGIYLLLLLASCHKALPDPFPAGTETFDNPVTATRIENVEDPSIFPGELDTEMIMIVPASDKPTPIRVEKKKMSVAKKLLTNEPEYKVTSGNQAVTAVAPKKTLWPRWAFVIFFLLFIVAAVAMAIANKIAGWSPGGMVRKIFKR